MVPLQGEREREREHQTACRKIPRYLDTSIPPFQYYQEVLTPSKNRHTHTHTHRYISPTPHRPPTPHPNPPVPKLLSGGTVFRGRRSQGTDFTYKVGRIDLPVLWAVRDFVIFNLGRRPLDNWPVDCRPLGQLVPSEMVRAGLVFNQVLYPPTLYVK